MTKAKSENQGWIFDFEATDAGKADQLQYKAARAIFRKSGTGGYKFHNCIQRSRA